MKDIRVLCSCLILASINVSVKAITPVRWTFYRDMNLTWNEASTFCRKLRGHLPVIDSKFTQSVFYHWIQEWVRQGNMTGPLWTGLYSPTTAGVAPYVWERDGAQQNPGVSFWRTSVGEPDNVNKELCTRMPSNGLWLTKACSHEYSVVCEFYEECCTYNLVSDTKALHTVSASRADVTSLEKCWSACEGDVTCVSAAWHTETAACDASSDEQEVPLTLGEDQIASPYLLQRCFNAETTNWSKSFTFSDKWDKPHPANPQSVAPQHFQCTLTFAVPMETTTPATGATTAMELESKHSTVPDTTQSQTTADTAQSRTTPDAIKYQTTAGTTTDTTVSPTTADTTQTQTTADTTIFQTTPHTSPSQTTADTTQSQTTADTTMSQTTADTTMSQTTPDTTMSQTTADTTQSQTIADTTQSQTTPQTSQSQTTADTTQSQITADTTMYQTTPDTSQSQTTADTTQSQTTPDTTQSQTTPDTTQSQTTPDTTKSQTTSDTTLSQTTADTTQYQASADTTQSQTTPDTTQSQTTPGTTKSQTTSDTTQSQTTSDTTKSQTTSDTNQFQTMSHTPEPLTSTTTELVHDVNASSSSAVLSLCPCSCLKPLTTGPPPPPLEIIMANSTSKFRRATTSEWSSPSLSECAITTTFLTIAAMFVLFALCPHPAAIERFLCSRDHKISASRSS